MCVNALRKWGTSWLTSSPWRWRCVIHSLFISYSILFLLSLRERAWVGFHLSASPFPAFSPSIFSSSSPFLPPPLSIVLPLQPLFLLSQLMEERCLRKISPLSPLLDCRDLIWILVCDTAPPGDSFLSSSTSMVKVCVVDSALIFRSWCGFIAVEISFLSGFHGDFLGLSTLLGSNTVIVVFVLLCFVVIFCFLFFLLNFFFSLLI